LCTISWNPLVGGAEENFWIHLRKQQQQQQQKEKEKLNERMKEKKEGKKDRKKERLGLPSVVFLWSAEPKEILEHLKKQQQQQQQQQQ